MAHKFSAYLQVYNDWSILPAALETLRSRVDELIVVDGAYDWMVPYMVEIGRDPEKSDKRVYDALDASGIPYRAIQRTWPNQLVKRSTGYASCSHDFIFRVDADELYFFDDQAFDAALTAGAAVASMEMPLYLAPGKLLVDSGLSTGTYQNFFFDRRQISPELHLNYLWLVLYEDKLPDGGKRPFRVHEGPIAFNAHLSTWRTADTSSNRTGYYVTNWMRAHGVPWIPALANKPLDDFQKLFSVVKPLDFLHILETNIVSLGTVQLKPRDAIVDSHVAPEIEGRFSGLYDQFLASLVVLNDRIRERRQPFVPGLPINLDVSTPSSRAALLKDATLTIEVEANVANVQAHILTMNAASSTNEEIPLTVRKDKNRVTIDIPFTDAPEILRQTINLKLWTMKPDIVQYLEVIK
jgi:hypothetical protein